MSSYSSNSSVTSINNSAFISNSDSVILKENNSLEDSWFSQNDCGTALPQVVSPKPIPVLISDRLQNTDATCERLPAVRRVLRRENKCLQALSLPTILSYNMRSIWGKLESFATDMIERSEGNLFFMRSVGAE